MIAAPRGSLLSYNAENKITGWLWSDGKARTITYDSNGLISAYSLGDPQGSGNAAGTFRTLSRDAAGRITGYSQSNNGLVQSQYTQSFAYDKLNRLLSASLNSSTTQYSYDATGNRTSKTIAGTTYTNTVATTSNKLTQTQDINGMANILYDAAGNIVNDTTFGYTYSDRGRLQSVTTAGGTVSYLYNGQSLRVSKSGPTAVVPTGAAYYPQPLLTDRESLSRSRIFGFLFDSRNAARIMPTAARAELGEVMALTSTRRVGLS